MVETFFICFYMILSAVIDTGLDKIALPFLSEQGVLALVVIAY